MTTTIEWLRNSLNKIENSDTLVRSGKNWKPVAGFSKVGCIFAVYKCDDEYCVHAGDNWDEDEAPSLGYYSAYSSWDDIVQQIANRYDNIRNSVQNTKDI